MAPGARVAPTIGLPDSSSHITTVGVKRTAFGQSGRALTVWTNHFEVKIPEGKIYHYDGVSCPIFAVPIDILNLYAMACSR